MRFIGKKSISSIIKIFLIILFILCVLSMIIVPILTKNSSDEFIFKQQLGTTIICIYLSSIPALIMLYQFVRIFESLEKENVFNKKIENRFLITSICSIIIGIIYLINLFIAPICIKYEKFDCSSIVVYLFFSIITFMIFLILGIGLIVLREIYKTAIKNKEENDLTI